MSDRKRWIVTSYKQVPGNMLPVHKKVTSVIEALECGLESGALVFYDHGLVRAFGAGSWVEVVRETEAAVDLKDMAAHCGTHAPNRQGAAPGETQVCPSGGCAWVWVQSKPGWHHGLVRAKVGADGGAG